MHDPLGIMNLWRIFKKKAMINAVQELSPIRKVLAKTDRIIIFGEDISDLGIWEKLLRQSKYNYQNEKWGNQTDISPFDIIDKSIALDSDGTERLEYCTYCNEWGMIRSFVIIQNMNGNLLFLTKILIMMTIIVMIK
jgi:hypothetical protein